MMFSRKLVFHLPLFFLLVLLLFSCNNSSYDQNKLIILHAGSLSVPVKEVSEAFAEQHPDVAILSEAAGSVACARKITDLGRECDVMLSADYTVINKFLIPGHADWNIKFAGNEMALVYTEKSAFAGQINQNNWPEILQKENVSYGRSNPDSDPCGYRTVITMKLAEKFYNKPGLSQHMLEKDNRYIRPKETDLLALLETHTLDYIFLYRSVAVQHSLPYLELPDSVNLSDPKLDDWYAQAEVKIAGKKPGEKIVQKGEAMVYGLTIPKNAPNYDMAVEFVRFWLEKDHGQRILEENGQRTLIPSPTKTYRKIPAELKIFATE